MILFSDYYLLVLPHLVLLKLSLDLPYLTTHFPQGNICIICINEVWEMTLSYREDLMQHLSLPLHLLFQLLGIFPNFLYNLKLQKKKNNHNPMILSAVFCNDRTEAWKWSVNLWAFFQLITELVISNNVCTVKLWKDRPCHWDHQDLSSRTDTNYRNSGQLYGA